MYPLTYIDETNCELCSTSRHAVLNTKVVLVLETQKNRILLALSLDFFQCIVLVGPKKHVVSAGRSSPSTMKFLCGAHALVVNGRWNLPLPSCWNWKVGPNLWKKPRSKPICNCDRCNMAAGFKETDLDFTCVSPEIVHESVVARG